MALGELYGDDAEKYPDFDLCLNTMATRIATVFASLKVKKKLLNFVCVFP